MKLIAYITVILLQFAALEAFGDGTNFPSSLAIHTNKLRADFFDKSFDECLVELQTNNSLLRTHALLTMRVQRKYAVNNLIAIVQGQASAEIKIDAIHALGQCRAAEAVDVIVENLSLEYKTGGILGRTDKEEEMWASFSPVSVALQRIGAPAIKPLMECVAKGSDPKISELALKIICRIEGNKDIVQLRLTKALEEEKDYLRQERLKSAIKILSDEHFVFELPKFYQNKN